MLNYYNIGTWGAPNLLEDIQVVYVDEKDKKVIERVNYVKRLKRFKENMYNVLFNINDLKSMELCTQINKYYSLNTLFPTLTNELFVKYTFEKMNLFMKL